MSAFGGRVTSAMRSARTRIAATVRCWAAAFGSGSSALNNFRTWLEVLVLELRYVGAAWVGQGTVHVELCDFDPDDAPWSTLGCLGGVACEFQASRQR